MLNFEEGLAIQPALQPALQPAVSGFVPGGSGSGFSSWRRGEALKNVFPFGSA